MKSTQSVREKGKPMKKKKTDEGWESWRRRWVRFFEHRKGIRLLKNEEFDDLVDFIGDEIQKTRQETKEICKKIYVRTVAAEWVISCEEVAKDFEEEYLELLLVDHCQKLQK